METPSAVKNQEAGNASDEKPGKINAAPKKGSLWGEAKFGCGLARRRRLAAVVLALQRLRCSLQVVQMPGLVSALHCAAAHDSPLQSSSNA